MKKFATQLFIMFSITVFGQNLAECGLDNNPKLSQLESEFMNVYVNDEETKHFDFTGKRVLFVTGNSGHTIGTKSEYFDFIKRWNADGHKIATWVVALNPNQNEQLKAGGYDVIVTYWVKVLTKRRIRLILESIK